MIELKTTELARVLDVARSTGQTATAVARLENIEGADIYRVELELHGDETKRYRLKTARNGIKRFKDATALCRFAGQLGIDRVVIENLRSGWNYGKSIRQSDNGRTARTNAGQPAVSKKQQRTGT